MAEITDIENEFIREEIEEYLDQPDEIERNIEIFSKATPEMQAISAALIDGDHHMVDELTKEALEAGTDALELMDDGLIAGDGYCGYQVSRELHFCPGSPSVCACDEGGYGVY